MSAERLYLGEAGIIPARPARRPQAESVPIWDRWVGHPAVDLTPARLNSIFRSAEWGYPHQQVDLFDDAIETDAHLRAALESRLRAVAGKEWILQPGGDAEVDILVARRLEEALRAAPNMAAMLEHQLKGLWYGYAASEVIWERARDGWTVPAYFLNLPPRRLIFDEDDTPRLLMDPTRMLSEKLAPGQWIFTRRQGPIAAKTGLMRTGTWWSFFKRRIMALWTVYADRYGLPFAYGQYAVDTQQPEKEALEKAVRSLGEDGWATYSEQCKITLAQPGTGSESVFATYLAFVNNELSKLVYGGTLTSDTQGPGSFALGRVHADVFFSLVLDDAGRESEMVEQAIGVPFCRYNGLPQAKPPRLKRHLVRETDPKDRMELYCRFANELGGHLDEDQVRQEFGFKQPSGGELVGTKIPGPKAPSSDGGGAV